MTWMDNIARKVLSGLEPYRPGKPIGSVQRELGLKEITRLSSNENPWPLPERVQEAIRNASVEINRYPDPESYYLRRALAKQYGVSPKEVIVGAGTESILYSLFQAVIDEGDEVVYYTPTYPLYKLAACAAGANCVTVDVPLHTTPAVESIMARCTDQTKVVVLCNPNNPTGLFIERDELIQLSAFLEGKQTLLVVDEAYAEFVTDPRYTGGVQLFRELGNVVILRTFSKIYGLAALRVGYSIAPKPIVEAYERVRRVFGVNKIGQAAALAALQEKQYIEDIRDRTIAERERLTSELMDMGLRVYPTHTNFLLVAVSNSSSITEQLLREGIIIRPGEDLGVPDHIRVSIGLPEENERFVSALRKVLKRSGK
ncbi:MAG: histidinol-phosphate transaminase [Synergistales bacterium]|nr:histidinol-phosphate transaminase [Synergistales bacterium]